MFTVKPFAPSDYQAVADIENSVYTDEFFSPQSFIDRDQRHEAHIKHGRFIAWYDNQPIAYAQYSQDTEQYHPHRFRLEITIKPEFQRRGVGTKLWETLNHAIAEFEPIGLMSNAREDKSGIEFLKEQGFTLKMRTWENRMAIANFDITPYAHLQSELEQQGIEILSLEQVLTQENAAQEYYQLHTEVCNDVPRAYAATERSYEDFAAWNLNREKVLKTGTFIAIQNSKMIGVSQLFSTDGDYLTIGLTGVRREARGKHIALALKVACLEWAKANNYPEIRTWNDSNNAPILALNTKLGFVQCPAWIDCIKEIQGEYP